jgi:methionyl-tRNA formyltransferase
MFKIIFLSSSDFTIPILENILENQNLDFREIIQKQINFLETEIKNENQRSGIFNLNFIKKLKEILAKDFIPDFYSQKPVLELLISQPEKENRGKIIPSKILEFARKSNLQIFTPEKLNKEIEKLPTFDIGVTASFGQILSSKVLETGKYGFINWHPSKLPQYRGPSPMQTSLYNGDKLSALSWIEMTKAMDAGNILLQINKSLNSEENIVNLTQKMANLGANTWALAILLQILKLKFPENNLSLAQNPDEISFCKFLDKSQSLVNPFEMTNLEIFNHFRAYQNFPKTEMEDKFFFKDKVKLLDCKICENSNFENILFENQIWIQAKNDKKIQTYLKAKSGFLEILKLGLSNGKQIKLQGFVMK